MSLLKSHFWKKTVRFAQIIEAVHFLFLVL